MIPQLHILISRVDRILSAFLLLFMASVVFTSGMANIQTDAIDYYAIVQRMTGDTKPVVPNLPFIEQRSPGYPLLTLPAAFALQFISTVITPEMIKAAPTPGDTALASEQALLPSQPVFIRQMLFKYYDLTPQGNLFKWHIIAAMLVTGYGLLVLGYVLSARTLTVLHQHLPGYCLLPLMMVTSVVFMHNLVNTPAYATLTVFGISAIFTWFWVRYWTNHSKRACWMAGLLAGWLVLIRLEMVLLVAVLLVCMVWWRKLRDLLFFILGGLVPLTVLLIYNSTQFGNPLHVGILKGNMNTLAIQPAYMLAVLADPRSGILFWSALAAFGVIGLFLDRSPALKALGWAAAAYIALIAVRVPVMFFCVGQGTLLVSGIEITCPQNTDAVLNLIRFDSNRYMIPLMPFAALGMRTLLGRLRQMFIKQPKPQFR